MLRTESEIVYIAMSTLIFVHIAKSTMLVYKVNKLYKSNCTLYNSRYRCVQQSLNKSHLITIIQFDKK